MSKTYKDLNEAGDPILDEIEAIVKASKDIFSLEKPLKSAGFNVKKLGGDVPLPPIYWKVTKKGKTFMIVNKRYVDKPDRLVGDIAIG